MGAGGGRGGRQPRGAGREKGENDKEKVTGAPDSSESRKKKTFAGFGSGARAGGGWGVAGSRERLEGGSERPDS